MSEHLPAQQNLFQSNCELFSNHLLAFHPSVSGNKKVTTQFMQQRRALAFTQAAAVNPDSPLVRSFSHEQVGALHASVSDMQRLLTERSFVRYDSLASDIIISQALGEVTVQEAVYQHVSSSLDELFSDFSKRYPGHVPAVMSMFASAGFEGMNALAAFSSNIWLHRLEQLTIRLDGINDPAAGDKLETYTRYLMQGSHYSSKRPQAELAAGDGEYRAVCAYGRFARLIVQQTGSEAEQACAETLKYELSAKQKQYRLEIAQDQVPGVTVSQILYKSYLQHADCS